MKIEENNFFAYKKNNKKKNLRSFIGIFFIVNLILLGNLCVIFSNYYVNYVKISSEKYNKAEARVIECEHLSNFSYSVKIEFLYYGDIIEKRVSTIRNYEKDSSVDILIDKNNSNSLEIISYDKIGKAFLFGLIAAFLLDLIMILIYSFQNKIINESNKKSLNYHEYKEINETFVNEKKMSHISSEKYMKDRKTLSPSQRISDALHILNNDRKKYIAIFLFVLIIICSSFNCISKIYSNFVVNNSDKWDIVCGKVSQCTSEGDAMDCYSSEKIIELTMFDINKKILLRNSAKLNAGDIVNVAVKKDDKKCYRLETEDANITITIITVMISIMFIKYIKAYE